MSRIKIAHEAPISIFNEIESITDYSYALVHLFEENEEYYFRFRTAAKIGREIILDNSILELGEAFDSKRFAHWIERITPTWYIIPDVLENYPATISNAATWMANYESLPGKRIGVIQGKTYEDIKHCYEYMDKSINVDMIGISFDYSYYETLVPHPNKYFSWMLGRVTLLGMLLRDKVINTNKPHHLLGAALPIEGKFYRNYNWIYSTDTSNPVVHGLKGIKYEENFGLYTKESQKLFTMITSDVSDEQLELVKYNVEQFRQYWNG